MKNSKLIRRIQSFALAILLIFVMLSATPAYASGVTEITFAAVETNVGDEVLVPVNIENNTGLAAFRFRVSYDTSALELLSVTKGSLLTSGTFESGTDADEKTLTFTWFNLCNVTGDGEIAVLRFKVSENAGGNYPLTVTYLPIDILNESYEKVYF